MSLIGKKSKATHPLAWTRQPSTRNQGSCFTKKSYTLVLGCCPLSLPAAQSCPDQPGASRRDRTGQASHVFSRAQSVAGSRIEPKTQMIRSEFQGLLFPRLWTNSTTSVRASRHCASPARPATCKADLLRIIGNSFSLSSRTREARAAFRPTVLTSPTSRWARTAGDQPLGIDRVFAHKADRGDLLTLCDFRGQGYLISSTMTP